MVDGQEGQTIRVGTIDEEKMARGRGRGGPMRQQFHVSFDDGGEKKMSWKEALEAIRIYETMENDQTLENDQRREEEAEAEVLEKLVCTQCIDICELSPEE